MSFGTRPLSEPAFGLPASFGWLPLRREDGLAFGTAFGADAVALALAAAACAAAVAAAAAA
eukprot:10017877-Alexandrium_andersonii.AAC.1